MTNDYLKHDFRHVSLTDFYKNLPNSINYAYRISNNELMIFEI